LHLSRKMISARKRNRQIYHYWMLSSVRFSPMSQGVADLEARIARIDTYVANHAYFPRPIEQRLSEEETRELVSIRERAAQLRKDLDQLIQKFRDRTGMS